MNRTCARPADRPSPAQRDGDHLRRGLRLFRRRAPTTSSAPRTSLNIVKQASFVGVIAVGMTFVLLTAGIDLSVGSNMYVSAMTVGYLLQLPGLQGGFGVFAGHRRRARDRRRLRRDQRVLHRLPAHHALPGDARDDGRRPRPRHRDHRVLRHRLSRGLHSPSAPRRSSACPIPIIDLRARGRRGPSRADPHGLRPAALCRRQRRRGGAESRHRRPTASSSPSTSSPGSARRSAASR